MTKVLFVLRDAAGNDAGYEQEDTDAEQILGVYTKYAAIENCRNIGKLKYIDDVALANDGFRKTKS